MALTRPDLITKFDGSTSGFFFAVQPITVSPAKFASARPGRDRLDGIRVLAKTDQLPFVLVHALWSRQPLVVEITFVDGNFLAGQVFQLIDLRGTFLDQELIVHFEIGFTEQHLFGAFAW